MINDQELEQQACREISQRVAICGPREPRVLNVNCETGWDDGLLRTISRNELHVLGRVPDIVVFLDKAGKVIGWRDDGEKGAEMPPWVDREAFRQAVVAELGLPEGTRLGALEPVELPPLGWTHQAVLFLTRVPSDEQILRIWVAPQNLHIIQCLSGPLVPPGGAR
jgi:hypothetical protein